LTRSGLSWTDIAIRQTYRDLVLFGLGVIFFLVITLGVIFRKVRWVVLSMSCSLAAVLVLVGVLGLLDWRVTFISSNFISLMLILTMSLTIHLIVRYLEVHAGSPGADRTQCLPPWLLLSRSWLAVSGR
jgi:predicted RND superfamily exporter protein